MNEFKKITIKSIYDLLNSSFPIANQETWDQSGLRLFDLKSTPISKIILCLDCTKDIIDYAIENNYKLIISHHPIFTKNKYFEPSKFDTENIKILKAHKISLLSLHTCIDNHEDGLNTYILKKIGVNNIQKNNCKYGCYFSGTLPNEITTKSFTKLLFKKLNLSHVIAMKNRINNKVKNIALCCGSGFSVFRTEINNLNQFDAILTGDIKWHDWRLVDQCKWALIDIGHDVEKNFCFLIKEKIEQNFKNISIKIVEPYLDFYFKTK